MFLLISVDGLSRVLGLETLLVHGESVRISVRSGGVFVEDGQRAEEIERLADKWVKSLTADKSCYKFRLQQTIYTEAEPDINQHFIVVKLHYDFFGSDDAPLNIKSM